MGQFKFSGPAKRLRIFIGEREKYRNIPLYHALVLKAKELDMAGVTVSKGIEGFGANSRIVTSRIVDISSDLPVIVEIVDSVEYIEKYLQAIDGMINEGLITMDDVEIIKYSNLTGERLKRLKENLEKEQK
ncbi:DUF190 domain-containing protein [Thermosyntropha sp.]|uniref:DUF190 domain-containing protein n=1 Tax=Thermosyntropha sp. TaxID=2740820 RepID=UPI0025FF5A0E|nr:DUF190 domain-containing protein [Thermosyntropha sp.]MBO8158182.1 DUF190 domain-containing protein [Thermosyntropha sp.]